MDRQATIEALVAMASFSRETQRGGFRGCGSECALPPPRGTSLSASDRFTLQMACKIARRVGAERADAALTNLLLRR